MLDEAPLEALPFINIIGARRPRSQQPKAAQPGRMDQATPHHRRLSRRHTALNPI
jgi:hypothetical protein